MMAMCQEGFGNWIDYPSRLRKLATESIKAVVKKRGECRTGENWEWDEITRGPHPRRQGESRQGSARKVALCLKQTTRKWAIVDS